MIVRCKKTKRHRVRPVEHPKLTVGGEPATDYGALVVATTSWPRPATNGVREALKDCLEGNL